MQASDTRDCTLVEVLAQRAALQPAELAFTLFGEGTEQSETGLRLTYGDLFEQAAGLAALLQAENLTGERVLLVFKSNALFVISFFACLMAGAIAVPTAPPRREHKAQRLRTIGDNAGARAGISDSDDIMDSGSSLGCDAIRWFDAARLTQGTALRGQAVNWRPPTLNGDSLAFLQYTSGSTGNPKGVMVTHGNLQANSRQMARAFDHDRDSRGLVALPLFHDMGLIAGIVQPVYMGYAGHVMTPTQFVQQPHRWLQLISRLRITFSGGPNFMYDLAAQVVQPSHLEGVDLSCWTAAFCGAEPIRASTIDRFTRKFSEVGFRGNSFYPCYGMAEATLFVTGNMLGTRPQVDGTASGLPVVGCGYPSPDTAVEIVDPKSRKPVDDGVEGEIWVSGPSVSQGYWKNPTATQRTFNARLAHSDAGQFLRTGDLGYRKNGNLFVTGRLKDLIILRGRNHAPQDLEAQAEASHPALQPGAGAAFTVTEGEQDRLVLVFELKREWRHRAHEWDLVRAAVRKAIALNYQLRLDDMVLLAPGALPRTSSGKVKRAQCRADYLQGSLKQAVPAALHQSKTSLAASAPGQDFTRTHA